VYGRIHEDVSTRLTPPSRKRTVFKGALKTHLAFDVYSGNPEDVRAIVKLGIEPDLLTDTSRALLGLSARAGNTEAVKFL